MILDWQLNPEFVSDTVFSFPYQVNRLVKLATADRGLQPILLLDSGLIARICSAWQIGNAAVKSIGKFTLRRAGTGLAQPCGLGQHAPILAVGLAEKSKGATLAGAPLRQSIRGRIRLLGSPAL